MADKKYTEKQKQYTRSYNQVILEDLPELFLYEGKYGPIKLKVNIVQYNKGRPGLNLQVMYPKKDGTLTFGKRPLLTKDILKFLIDNDIIKKSYELILLKHEKD